MIGNYCIVHVLDVVILTSYVLCFLLSSILIRKHKDQILSGQAGGLACFLIFTTLLSLSRAISIIIVLNSDPVCDYNYRSDSYTEVIDLFDGYPISREEIVGIMLSTLSLSFFYTSYSYFAYSLNKVLEMLLRRYDILNPMYSLNDSRYFSIYVGLITTIWISTFLVFITIIYHIRKSVLIFIFSRIAIALTALSMSIVLLFNYLRAIYYMNLLVNILDFCYFFYRLLHGIDSGRGLQLAGLLKIRRIQGVCYASIVIFTIRSITLIFEIKFSPIVEDMYLILVEVIPTIFMLLVFRRSTADSDTASIGLKLSNEMDTLRSSLTNSILPVSILSIFYTSSGLTPSISKQDNLYQSYYYSKGIGNDMNEVNINGDGSNYDLYNKYKFNETFDNNLESYYYNRSYNDFNVDDDLTEDSYDV